MNTEQTIMDAYTIAYGRREMADLDEDGVSQTALAFAEALVAGMHPTKATWDALRATERNYLRLGWNEVSQEYGVLEGLIDGALCALDEEDDAHIDVRWTAKNAIQAAEDSGDFERAYSIALALEEWEAAVPTSQIKPDTVYDATPIGNHDDVAARIASAYEDIGADEKIIAAAVAASSTTMGYTSEEESAADIEQFSTDVLSGEAERHDNDGEFDWEHDNGEVEVLVAEADEHILELVSTWTTLRNAENARRYGLSWIKGNHSRATMKKAQARLRDLADEISLHNVKFTRLVFRIAARGWQLTRDDKIVFCNSVARFAVDTSNNDSTAGQLYGAVRSGLATQFGLSQFEVENGRVQDSYQLTFTEEQQGTALLRFVANIPALNEPEDPDWRVYLCKEWQQQHALLALRGRQSFHAVSDAVKASLKNGNNKYIHSGVKDALRRYFAAQRKREAQLSVKRLYTTGVTVEQADGNTRFIEWNNLLRRAHSLRVEETKRESFIAALTGLGGLAQRVAEVIQ